MEMPDEMTTHAETSVNRAIDKFRSGGIVIIVDDEERENEGDFAMAAEMVTPEAVNFMALHGRGLICVPMEKGDLDRLDLPPMVGQEHRAVGHRVHGLGRRPHRRDDRHISRRPRPYDKAARR